MITLELIRRLWAHLEWADRTIRDAVARCPADSEATREFAHIVGVEEVWLSRLEGRRASLAVWPDPAGIDVQQSTEVGIGAFRSFIDQLGDADMERDVSYTNSAGLSFTSRLSDILLHVFLHGQYHRGKINQLLRQGGAEPAPVDFIAFVRGAPAATTADAAPFSRARQS